MKGDFHVRFRENVRVKFPRVTRLAKSNWQLAKGFAYCTLPIAY